MKKNLLTKKYVRDSRSPVPKNAKVSRVMSANKGSGTKIEVSLRKELWKKGVRGYRKNWKKVPGRPDIAFPSRKIAIFINGCYWHHCPICDFPIPKTNSKFWKDKFTKNIERDKKKLIDLKKMGWKTYVIWEHDIIKDKHKVVEKIVNFL